MTESPKETAFVKEDEFTLEIEGVRYAKALFRELGIRGGDLGTLFKLVNRDGGVITIQTMKYDEALEAARAEGFADAQGQAAKIVEEWPENTYSTDCDHKEIAMAIRSSIALKPQSGAEGK